jgi:hypothetical protein
MAEQVINNGAFDNDGTAEKIRLAFEKAKDNFAEIYTTVPQVDASVLSGEAGKFLKVNVGETAFELDNVPGGGDMLGSNNLSEVVSVSIARTNLGLGTAAVAALIDQDSFADNDDTKVPSQQSVKAYVDAQVLNYAAGTGISIDVTDPQNPIINNDSAANNIDSLEFDPSDGTFTINLVKGRVAVDLSAYTVLKKDGITVDKGAGNTDYEAIEVGDYYHGWDGESFVAGKANALPYDDPGNTDYAINGTII